MAELGSAVAGNSTEKKMAGSIFRYDSWAFRELFQPYAENDIIEQFEYTKSWSTTEDSTFKTAELGMMLSNAKIASRAAFVGAGGLLGVTLTLDATSHQDGGKSSPFVVGETIRFKDGFVGLIVAKNTSTNNAHTISVNPIFAGVYNATTTPGAEFYEKYSGRDPRAAVNLNTITGSAAGNFVFLAGSAYKNGSSGASQGTNRTPSVYNSFTQNIRTMHAIDGTSGTNMLPLSYEGKNYGVDLVEIECLKLHKLELSQMVFFGKNGFSYDVNGDEVRMSDSIESYTADFGTTYQGQGGVYGISDFEKIVFIDKRETMSGNTKRLMHCGLGAKMQIDAMVRNITEKGGIVYDKQLVDLTFERFKLGHVEFYYKTDDMLTHRNGAGSVGHSYDKTIFVLPYGKMKNPSSQKEGWACELKYKKGRKFLGTPHGLMSSSKNSKLDANEFEYLTEAGLAVLGMRALIKMVM